MSNSANRAGSPQKHMGLLTLIMTDASLFTPFCHHTESVFLMEDCLSVFHQSQKSFPFLSTITGAQSPVKVIFSQKDMGPLFLVLSISVVRPEPVHRIDKKRSQPFYKVTLIFENPFLSRNQKQGLLFPMNDF